MTSEAELTDLAERLTNAIEAADVETLKRIYAPGAVIWMNTTGREVPAGQVTGFLPHLAKRIQNRRYVERQVRAFADGFVQRHRMTGRRRDGADVSVLACLVCTVADGRITRLEEYCDAAQLKAFMS